MDNFIPTSEFLLVLFYTCAPDLVKVMDVLATEFNLQ